MKIVCFDVKEYEVEELKKLKNFADEVVLLEDSFHLNFDKNLPQIQNADVVSVFVSSRLEAENLCQLPNLKFIATRSTGFSHIDLDYCKKKQPQSVERPTLW